MPLNTQVKRKGKLVKYSWDYNVLSCFLTAAIMDQKPEWVFRDGKKIGDLDPLKGQFVDFSMAPIYYMDMDIDLWKKGQQTLKNDYTFDIYTEASGKAPVIFLAGDKLMMHRS